VTSASISSCTTPRPTPTLNASSPSLAAPTSSPVDGGGQASATSADGLPIAKPDFAPALRVVAMRTPLFVLRDTVAQFPTCSEAYLVGVEALDV
jgi:hypothetical protein